jgi:hypothetical protein
VLSLVELLLGSEELLHTEALRILVEALVAVHIRHMLELVLVGTVPHPASARLMLSWLRHRSRKLGPHILSFSSFHPHAHIVLLEEAAM